MDTLLKLLVLAETEQEHRDTHLVFTEAGVSASCHQTTTADDLCRRLQATDFAAIVLNDTGITSQTQEALDRIGTMDSPVPVIILTALGNTVTSETTSIPAPLIRRVDRNNLEDILAAANWAITAQRNAKLQRWLTSQARDQHHLATIGTITSGMSHDFSNYLTAISGSVSLLVGRFPEDPLAEKALAMIQDAAQQATNLAKSLMYAEQRLPVVTKSFDLNRLAHDATASLVANTNPRFDISIHPEKSEPNWVTADREQVWLVLISLIAAASENAPTPTPTPSGGKLRISIECPPKQTEACAAAFATVRLASPQPWIEVGSTSPGTSPGTSPDRAAYTHAPAVENAGLTLPLLAGLVHRQGGSMRLGAGTADDPVAFTLPTAPPPPPRPNDVPHVTRSGVIAMLTHRCYYGLLLGAGLTTVGFQVRRATRAADLLRMFDRQPAEIDLLLLEAAPPQVDGVSCLQALRAQGITQPAILLIGSDQLEIETSQLAETTVVHKPVNLAELAKVCLMAHRDAKDSS